jgi:hypothetical protein
MSVGDYNKVSFGIGHPFNFAWIWRTADIWINKVRRMFLKADILVYTR